MRTRSTVNLFFEAGYSSDLRILAKAIESLYCNTADVTLATLRSDTCSAKGGGMGKVMVYIVHDRTVDRTIQDILTELKIDHFSRFRDALEARAPSREGDEDLAPHSVTIAVVEEGERRRLLGKLKSLQVDSPLTSIRAFVVSVLEAL